MSDYGPGGPRPGQPSGPWQGNPALDDARRPDQHGDSPPVGPTSPAEPAGPRRHRSAAAAKISPALLVTLIVVLIVVVCGGGGLALYLMSSQDEPPAAHGRPASTGPAGHGMASAASPGGAPGPSDDPASIVRGRCVANDGTEDAPQLRVVTCGQGAYLVLARYDGTDDTHRCDPVAGATHNFYYQTTPSSLDFVLCLKRQ